MFCKYCGQEIHGDSVFCKSCGKNITIDSHVSEPIVQTPIYKEPIIEQPIYQTPIIQQPVYTAPIRQEPIYQTPIRQESVVQQPRMQTPVITQEPKTKTYIPDFEPASVYPHMDEATQTEPAPKIEYKRIPEAPPKKRRKKGKVLPFIFAPVAHTIGLINYFVVIVIVGAFITPLLYPVGRDIYNGAYNILNPWLCEIGFLSVAIAFSFCCKGFNKKARFVLSCFSANMLTVVTSIVYSVVGFITLITVDFDFDRMSIVAVSSIAALISMAICFMCAPLSLLWFSASEKYTINKEVKTPSNQLVLPCVFLAVHALFSIGLQIFVQRGIGIAFSSYGDNASYFGSQFASLVGVGSSYICMFLFALACKGGYRKLAFVGSVVFSRAILSFIPGLLQLVATLINDGTATETNFYDIGRGVQFVLAALLSIGIYLFMNKYAVEKK